MVTFSDEIKLALDAFATPVWVIDVQRAQLIWANQSALTLFGAFTIIDLAAREPMRAAGALLVAELARLALGERFDGEFRIAHEGGERAVNCTFTGIASEAGRRLALVETRADQHAPVSLRAVDVEQRLQSRDRMASIGTLTAGVVHGINNPLSYVIANLEYVKRLLAKGPERLLPAALVELGDVLEDSLDGAERVRRIVSDLGSFSQPAHAPFGAVDLERAAERALGIAANEIKHRARVIRDFSGPTLAVGTEAKLSQVILSVLINAAHAIEPGAVEANAITLRTRVDELGRPTLQIEDTGCGIAEGNLGRVFDPFFTTKPVGVGTGLGLFIAQRMLRELDGEIVLESVHGVGTRVVLSLPPARVGSTQQEVSETLAPLSTERFRARILIIDDEPAILRAFRRLLFSHEVVMAASGEEALTKLAEGPRFDVIFCDVMMPQMSGVEVYQRIAKEHAGQEHQLVFMSGGVFTDPALRFLETAPNLKLKKPFTGSMVRTLVARVMHLL